MYRMPGKWERAWLRLKWPLLDVLHRTGFSAALLRMRPGPRVVTWHGVDTVGSTQWNTRYVSQEMLETQVKWLAAHCQVVTVEAYWKGDYDPQRLTVCLTLDDGLANNFTRALPVFRKYNVPATFFVTPVHAAGYDILWPDLLDLVTPALPAQLRIGGEDFVKRQQMVHAGTGKTLKNWCRESGWDFVREVKEACLGYARFREDPALRDYWQLMTPEQIREMAAVPGMEIGSHGLRHLSLGRISRAEAQEEMRVSRQVLETITGQPVLSLGFPDGSYVRQTVEDAEALGYTRQLASQFFFAEDAQDDRLRERFGMNPFISWKNQQYALLRGTYF